MIQRARNDKCRLNLVERSTGNPYATFCEGLGRPLTRIERATRYLQSKLALDFLLSQPGVAVSEKNN